MIKSMGIGRVVEAATNLYSPDFPGETIVPVGELGRITRKTNGLAEVSFANGVHTYCSQDELNPSCFRVMPLAIYTG